MPVSLTQPRDGAVISLDMAAQGTVNLTSATLQSISLSVAGALTLALPVDFGVDLLYDAAAAAGSKYSASETTGAHELSAFTGSTVYVATMGDDTAGTGAAGAPYATITKAITEAVSGDRISIAPGDYACPASAIAKDLAFVRTGASGFVCIGTFDDLSGATITDKSNTSDFATTENYFGCSTRIVGFMRLDGTATNGVRGSAIGSVQNYEARGVQSCVAGSSSSNIGFGTSELLADVNALIAAGNIRAWTGTSTQGLQIATGSTVYFGEGLIIASYAQIVVEPLGTATVILDRCEIYGGSEACLQHEGNGAVRAYGMRMAGSAADCMDYKGGVLGLEVGCFIKYPGINLSDNASTAHGGAKVLRVGGEYAGGSRTIHDIDTTENIVVSCVIEDAFWQDQTLHRIGNGADLSVLTYGDLTYSGIRSSDLVVDAGATANDGDATWPYS